MMFTLLDICQVACQYELVVCNDIYFTILINKDYSQKQNNMLLCCHSPPIV